MSIHLRQVTFSYQRGHRVLDQVDLTIRPGDRVALTGPSGSGKTTLLHIIGGLLKPDAGHVTYTPELLDDHGTVIAGWVFQASNALNRRTVLDNVASGLFASGLNHSEARARAEPYLRAVGLGGKHTRHAGSLSGGELQRVGIARAVVSSPPLILADEPTGQLDLATTRHVLDAMFAVVGADAILITASHDPEVTHHCSRVVSIVNGVTTEES